MKRVLVTGASRGIGRAIARRLAADGHAVTLNFRSKAVEAESLKTEIEAAGGQASLLPFDIADREATRSALEADMAAHGAFWGVVANAGIAKDAPFPLLEGDAWDAVINTNLTGLYNVLKPLVMPMVEAKQGGRIVTLSSVSGLMGNRGQANYSASKAGIIGVTRTLAKELARRKICVNCIAPGLIETEMLDGLENEKAEILKMIPMRRYGKPEEVANLASFLVSDQCSYITGEVISVNGGML